MYSQLYFNYRCGPILRRESFRPLRLARVCRPLQARELRLRLRFEVLDSLAHLIDREVFRVVAHCAEFFVSILHANCYALPAGPFIDVLSISTL